MEWLNVELDSPVQHIAFAPAPALVANRTIHAPELFASHLTIAASCTNRAIVLVSIPFAAKQDVDPKNVSDIKITHVDEECGHGDLISALSLTWTIGTPSSSQQSAALDASASFLIASASPTGSGLLILHQISLKSHLAGLPETYVKVATQLVRLPLLDSVLAFSPHAYHSRNHLSLLLTSPARGIIQIYDLAKSSLLSERKDDDIQPASAGPSPRHRLEVSLVLCTARNGPTESRSCRPIVDASWDSSGQAILGLLADGEWGLWNISGPDTKFENADYGRFTSFGQLHAMTPTKKTSKTKSSGSLAPMTPHTRKTRSDEFFGKTNPPQAHYPAFTTGKITLCSPSRLSKSQDDAVILSYNGLHHYLQSLQAHNYALSGRSQGEVVSSGRIRPLPEVRLGGGTRLSTHTIHSPSTGGNGNFLTTLGEIPDLLVLADSRLIVYAKAAFVTKGGPVMQNLTFRSIGESKSTGVSQLDKTLDTDDIDKILDSMEGGDVSSGQGLEEVSNDLEHSQQDDQNLLNVGVRSSFTSTARPAKTTKLFVDRKQSDRRPNLFAQPGLRFGQP